jgi:thiamine biosynthesis lipoprotein
MDRIEQLNSRLSDYLEESELSQLCRQAPVRDAAVSQDLWQVLLQAQRVAAASGGAFDPTIGPFSRLWRTARRAHQLPTTAELQSAAASVGRDLFSVAPNRPSVSLSRPHMQLDLGGIAKGFAADEALSLLRQRGFPAALVEGGGDMAIGAPPPGKPGWRVAVAALEKDQPPTRILQLAHVGLATSGDLWQFVELDGVRYSHLIDPRTGMGITRRSSVTVVARNATLADAWASAGSVLAPAAALASWRRNAIDGLVLWIPNDQPGSEPSREGVSRASIPRQAETEGMACYRPNQHAAQDGL